MSNSRKRHLEEVQSSSEHREQKVTQPQRLHYGLYNQGNTCYLNSVLQVLFVTKDFHNRLDPKSELTDKELRKFFEKLKGTTCGTENIAKTFEMKNVNHQSDAAECLQFILQKVSTRASEVFQGELTYSTECSEGHIINDETNPFWTLPMPLKDAHDSTFSLEQGFERIFKTTRFSGDNMVYCNKCQRKTEATSGCEMTEFPRNLILLLKRFDIDYSTMSHFKSDCCVEVPRVLQRKNKKYRLYGMVNHMGSLRCGHYTATILSEDNTWYEFNDNYVQKVKEPFAQTRTHNSHTAYLLLYRASGSEREEEREQYDQTGQLDQQMGHKVEHKRFREIAVTQPQRLHYGLYNQGNTCYLNSVLQVLFVTTDFHDRLDPKTKFTDKELRKFFEKLKAATCGTENIAKAFEIKNVNQQSDAAECLQFILQKVSTQASEVFQGELTYSTECSEGHIINDVTNAFWTLPMPLKDTQDSTFSVERSFERIFKTTRFSGDKMVYCNKCQRRTEATSGCEMTEFPQNLILLLKRFDIDYSTMSHFKSDCCVEVPRVLQRKNKKYRLYGMVNHMGSLGCGHYTATILSEDNTWYEFNDDYVQKVKEPFAQTRTHNSHTAYLLLYRASGSEREEERERYDQTGQLDQQMGHKVEHKRFREIAVTQPQRLHYGLYNQGNTCYLNSVLQVLFVTTDFHDRLDPKTKFTDKELRKFFEKLKAATCGTENIAKAFEIKNVNQQSDAAECLQFILQKVSTQASEVFQGELTYSTECSKGHIINDVTNAFWTLPMPLKDTQDSTFSVERSFERIFKTTRFSGDKMVYCNKCQRRTEATSGCEMTEFPRNLILLLKRFDIDYSTMSHFKSDCCVEVPRVLQRKNKKYRLYGMVNHMGSLGCGHYTATILSEDNTWYEFNDNYVQKVKEPFAQTRTHNSHTAYLLLYRASGSEREEERERYDQTGQLDQQMGHKVEHKRFREIAVTQPQRLHYGLYNQGNTCYLNSVLQVLFVTTDFHDRLDPKTKFTDKELRKFFEKLKAATCGTENIAKAFEIKNVNQQSDAAECLQFILQKVSTQASEIFQGELTYSTECSKGHIINDETNAFWTLPMPLKDTQDSTFSVERSFERIFKTTRFSGDKMVYCNKCQRKTEATSGCEMTEFPRNLILLLKRFDIDYSTMSHFKSDCCVEVPHVLQRKNKKYRLYGMVNHMGSLRCGHYTATILSEDNTWYEFNDDYVQKVKEPFAQTRTHSSRTAYLLLYRASRSQRDEGREQNVETGHLDQQIGRIRGSAGENRQAQESRARMGKESGKGSFGHHYIGEKGDPEHGRKDSSVTRKEHRIRAEEDVLLPKNETIAYSSEHHPNNRKKPSERIQMSRKQEDLNSEPPCKRLADILKNRFVIGAIIAVGLLAIAVILIPVLVSNRPTIIDRQGNP